VRKRLFVLTLLVAGAAFGQLSIGIRIGAPPPVRVLRVQPRSPGADYSWIAGYWYPVGNHYKWHDGYWTRPAYNGARWVEPRHDGQQYYGGYWAGERGEVSHDHRWDRGRSHQRDFERGKEHK
jgi:hypothetical protein